MDFSFLTSAIGIMWCAGNNPICIFECHFQELFRRMLFGGSRMLSSAVFSRRNSIYFSSINHKWFSSGISESEFSLLGSLLFAQGPLVSDSKGDLLYKTRWQQAFHGSVHQGPYQSNMLPTQICCSADFLTLWTCCRQHALTEAFESRGLFVSSLQQCLATQWYLLLS